MSPAVANFLFETANLLLLAAALGWMFFKPVRRTLDAEQARRDNLEKEAGRLRADAEAQIKQARESQERIDRELAEQRRAILDEAGKESDRILEEARAKQQAERSTFEQELNASRDNEAVALAQTVGRIAAESVGRLLANLDGPSLDLALARAACAELRTLVTTPDASASVESARPLDDDARKLLEAVLGAGFVERVVGDLGAGVRVTTSTGQVDATAAAIARRIAHEMSVARHASQVTAGGSDG